MDASTCAYALVYYAMERYEADWETPLDAVLRRVPVIAIEVSPAEARWSRRQSQVHPRRAK
jgi:hypothetical protein